MAYFPNDMRSSRVVSAWLMWTLLKWLLERTLERSGQIDREKRDLDKSNRCLSALIVECHGLAFLLTNHVALIGLLLESTSHAWRENFVFSVIITLLDVTTDEVSRHLLSEHATRWYDSSSLSPFEEKKKEIAVAIYISFIHSSAFSCVRAKRVRSAHNDIHIKHACRYFVLSRSNDSARLIRAGYDSS